ncbi:hypothetical protein KSS87_003090 [Heliosperma pusillum]|nr:hypothetical protein KSS87_003090 [Heliosperma pusillum]
MVAQDNKPQLSSLYIPDCTKLCNTLNNRIFQDVAGDVTIVVNGESYLLHKFPLVSRCGKFRKMVAEAMNSNLSMFQINDLPGGAQAFELAAKFCYGMNFEITAGNIAFLRCAAEYLEMTEDYQEENLISRTEAYIDEVMAHSIEKSMEVLFTCESLSNIVQQVDIPRRCVDAIARNACKEQLTSSFDQLGCDEELGDLKEAAYIDWWVEDLSGLRIDFYQQVISEMMTQGINCCSVIASLMHYAQVWLKGIGKLQIWNPARLRSNCNNNIKENDQKLIVESLVNLLPPQEKSSMPVPLTFLFGLLRMAIMVDANVSSRLELERRVGFRLQMVALDDLLIPSAHNGDSLFDVDTICRILENFLQRMNSEESEESGYESQGFSSPSHGSLLQVGRLIDAYLAEIAPDPHLSLQKFTTVIETLPDYARVIDDGLYRAIDIYLKAHSMLTDDERKMLSKYIDCQKLSQEACTHAAQNDRLPVVMTVRVLYHEQIRLRNAMSVSSGEGPFSQKMSSGIPSAAMSPRDTYASLRRENRELKLEIARMRMRLNDLEKEQTCMKQEMLDNTGNSRTFFTSLSKGIGKISIFSAPSGNKRQKPLKKGKGNQTGRGRRDSIS